MSKPNNKLRKSVNDINANPEKRLKDVEIYNKGKKDAIDEIIKMYPDISDDKDKIYDKCFQKRPEEMILDEITFNNKTYFANKAGCVYDIDAKYVGFINSDKDIILFENIRRSINDTKKMIESI